MKVVGLSGGIGGSRLWSSMLRHRPETDLTVVVNTGEDLWLHGLRICPDLDTVLYALSGRQDTERGWGVQGETWNCRDALAELAGPQWFNLGDRDLAVHLYRTGQLRAGRGLAAVTSDLVRAFGLSCRLLPATEAEVTTRVVTADGRDLHYQEFLVRERAEVPVSRSYLAGPAVAKPTVGVLAHLMAADVVVVGPSNPLASVRPILDLDGVRPLLRSLRGKTVVVTPTVQAVPIDSVGEAARARSRAALLRAAGFDPTPPGIARFYADVAGTFVLDRADSACAAEIAALGLEVVFAETLLHRGAHAGELVDGLLARAGEPLSAERSCNATVSPTSAAECRGA